MYRVVNFLCFAVCIHFGLAQKPVGNFLGKFDNDDETTNYRLPNNSLPISYDLWLKTDVDKQNFDFQGNVKIAIEILEPSTAIVLHLRRSQIDKIDMLNFPDTGVVRASNLPWTYEALREFLTINLPAAASVGEKFILDIDYHGVLREDKAGFYYASYKDENNVTVYYGTTQFEMTDARHVMPCFDEPGIRAPITLHIQHSKNYFAIANMPVNSTVESGDYFTTTFEPTPKMQTYLLAFLISNFKFKSNNYTQVEQRVYAVPQAIDNGSADYAVSAVDAVLRTLETHLKVPYPLEKMDHAAITDFAYGAMENFGLITYVDVGLLWNSQEDSESKKKDILELISHEYAHQYFGNIVSPKWWQYTWLNEGFATLFAYVIPSEIHPLEDFIYRFHMGPQAAAFASDKQNAVPLNHYVQTPIAISNKFDVISYSKGGSVLRMFQQALGEETFAKGLKYYLEEMYYESATPSDLHRNLQKAFDEDDPGNLVDLDKFMSTFETQAGYPIISVKKTLDSTNNTVFEFTQKSSTGRDEVYFLPITYMSATDKEPTNKPKLWMQSKTYQMLAPNGSEWILLNIFQNGYYKVEYSREMWSELVKEYPKFPNINRLKIVDEIPFTVAESVAGLELLKFLLPIESDVSVWQKVRKVESFLSDRILGSELQKHYDEYLNSLLAPHLDRLGLVAKPQESDKDAAIRRSVMELSCKLLNETCLQAVHDRWAAQPFASYADWEYCAAFRLMDMEIFDEMNFTADWKNYFAQYFACSLDRQMLERSFVHFFVDITPQVSMYSLIHYAMTTEFGGLAILDFMSREIEVLPQIRNMFLINWMLALHPLNSDEINWRFKRLIGMSRNRGFITEDQYQMLLYYAFTKAGWLDENPELYEFLGVDKDLEDDKAAASSIIASSLLIAICAIMKTLLL